MEKWLKLSCSKRFSLFHILTFFIFRRNAKRKRFIIQLLPSMNSDNDINKIFKSPDKNLGISISLQRQLLLDSNIAAGLKTSRFEVSVVGNKTSTMFLAPSYDDRYKIKWLGGRNSPMVNSSLSFSTFMCTEEQAGE